MKEKRRALRGEVKEGSYRRYLGYNRSSLVTLLHDECAQNRTLALQTMRHLGMFGGDDVDFLCKLLQHEKQLYVRLELQAILSVIGKDNFPALFKYLGQIGSNQELTIGKPSLKRMYPLPRDLIARIIGKMSLTSLDAVFDLSAHLDDDALSALIDGLGFLIYFDQDLARMDYFGVMNALTLNRGPLIRWKFYRFASAFHGLSEVYDYLSGALEQVDCVDEVRRSLSFFECGYPF